MNDVNLVIENYGVTLRRLTHDKIELLRQWRNDPKIQQYMFYKEYITEDMQERWFQGLNQELDYYFIIEYGGEEIGMINLKDINHETRIGEGGVFIYTDKYLNTEITYRAHLVMYDWLFENDIISAMRSHIRNDNPRAERFALFMGSKPKESDGADGKRWLLLKEDYMNNENRLRFMRRWERAKLKKLNL